MGGIDRLFSGLRSSSSGMAAERVRIDVIAENIANARTTRTPEGGAYRRKQVEFEPLVLRGPGGKLARGLGTPRIVLDNKTPMEMISNPSHPDANADGMVEMPNVNTILEMADLITAMRSYEAGLAVQQNFVRMAERGLELLR